MANDLPSIPKRSRECRKCSRVVTLVSSIRSRRSLYWRFSEDGEKLRAWIDQSFILREKQMLMLMLMLTLGALLGRCYPNSRWNFVTTKSDQRSERVSIAVQK